MALAFLMGSVRISLAVIMGLVLQVNRFFSLPTLSQTAVVEVEKVISLQYFCQDVLLASFTSFLTSASQHLNAMRLLRVGCRLCCRFAARFDVTSSAQRGVYQGFEYLGVTSSLVCLKQMALVPVIF